MKKKKLLKILFMAVILMPVVAMADTFSVSVDCKKYTSSIASVYCDISLNTDFTGSNLKMNVSSGNSKISFTANEGINSSINNNVLTISNSFDSGTVKLGTIEVAADIYNDKPGDTKTVTISDISMTNNSKEAVTASSINGSSYLYSETIGLSSLTVSGVDFEFDWHRINYNLEVDSSVSSVTVSAEKRESTDTITGIGTHNLNYGLNTIEVIVTNKEGIKKPYVLNITRPEPGVPVPEKKKDNFLTKIEFLGYDIQFDKNKTDYSITVDNKVNKLGFCSKDVDDSSYLCLVTLPKEYFTIDGEKYYFLFNGRDEAGYIEEYEKIYEKAEAKENDLGGYSFYIDGELYAKSNDVGSIIYLKTSYGDLKVGENTFNVVVVAENGDERTYTFTINRKNEDNKLLTDEELDNSPSTGSTLIIIVSVILVISLGVTIYFLYKRNKDNKGNNKTSKYTNKDNDKKEDNSKNS